MGWGTEHASSPPVDVRSFELLAAARNWQANLIPGTGCATWPACERLIAAITAFDQPAGR